MLLVLLDGLKLVLLLIVTIVAVGVGVVEPPHGVTDWSDTELTLFNELNVGSCLIESSLRMWWSSWNVSGLYADEDGEVEETARLLLLLPLVWLLSWT